MEQQNLKTTPLATLPPADRAYLALSADHNEQTLVEKAKKYTDITEIKDKADYRMVLRGNIDFKKLRTGIRASGKAARDDARQFAKAVIDEENRLVAIIEPEETRLGDLRKGYEDELERKAEEVLAIEVRRLADINTRIMAISAQADGLLGADAVSIRYRLDATNTIECTETLFAEFDDRALEVKAATVAALEQALALRVEFEAQVEANARIAQDQAERQAELDQQAEEQRERDRIAQEKIEDERKENARIMREGQEKAEAERVRIDSIQQCITDIRLSVDGIDSLHTDEIKDRITTLDNTDLTSDVWQEFADQAAMAITSTKAWLEKALEDRIKAERIEQEKREAEEAERLKAESARLEALKPEAERLLAWADKIDSFDWPVIVDPDLTRIRQDAVDSITYALNELRSSVSAL